MVTRIEGDTIVARFGDVSDIWLDTKTGMYNATRFVSENGKSENARRIGQFRRKGHCGELYDRNALIAAFAATREVPEEDVWRYDEERDITLVSADMMKSIALTIAPELEVPIMCLLTEVEKAVKGRSSLLALPGGSPDILTSDMIDKPGLILATLAPFRGTVGERIFPLDVIATDGPEAEGHTLGQIAGAWARSTESARGRRSLLAVEFALDVDEATRLEAIAMCRAEVAGHRDVRSERNVGTVSEGYLNGLMRDVLIASTTWEAMARRAYRDGV